MSVIPSQTPGVLARFGLTQAQAEHSALAVDANGRLFEGAAAVNRALQDCRGLWPLLGALYFALSPLRWIEDRLYRWVADNRPLLSRFYSTTPECERPGVECERW